jgi:hypothetical protein
MGNVFDEMCNLLTRMNYKNLIILYDARKLFCDKIGGWYIQITISYSYCIGNEEIL